MNRSRCLAGAALVALVLGATGTMGCAESTPQPPSTAAAAGGDEQGAPSGTAADVPSGPEVDELLTFHRNHHEGFIGFALASIPSLGVSADKQAAVEKIRTDIDARFDPAQASEAALLRAIAEGVAAGSLEQAKLDATLSKIGEVSTQMDDATNDAINQLHAALAPPERAALALKVEAHFQLWLKANGQDAFDPQIAMLGTQIALTPEQVAKARAGFASAMAAANARFDPAAAEQHVKAFVAGFPADQFDAKTLVTADKANSAIASWGAMRMTRFYQALVPALTPEQRTKLAALLRDDANKLEGK